MVLRIYEYLTKQTCHSLHKYLIVSSITNWIFKSQFSFSHFREMRIEEERIEAEKKRVMELMPELII